jgi:glutamine synthetase
MLPPVRYIPSSRSTRSLISGFSRSFGGAISGDSHAINHEPLPTNWDYALQRFTRSSFAYATLGQKYRTLFSACKQQELSEFSLRVTDVEYDAYIRTV